MLRSLLASLCILLGSISQSHAQAGVDTVVLRVTSPRADQVFFSGLVGLRDGKTERRFDNVRTPFELRLPAQSIDARFGANGGGSLAGELITYRAGKQSGRVTGDVTWGSVFLYFDSAGAFGFGRRFARRM